MFLFNTANADVDKSGVKPSVLSLPSGPGSIEGLGDSFKPQLNSGTVAYRIPLRTLPGRSGFAPDLALSYNSGNGNGFFGLGWKLEFPSIQRQTDKGIPLYTDYPNPDGVDNDNDGIVDEYDEYDTFILSGGEELVPVAGGFYRVENESSFMRFQRTDGWIANQKDGTTLYFGTTASSRVSDGSGKEFKYYLDKMVDTNGNEILFTYEKKDTGNQIYCTKIEYNKKDTSSMTIEFGYELRSDIIKNYKPGFELKTAYRCNNIKMYESGNHVRSYRLDYASTSSMQPLSMLSKLTQLGKDGETELPPASFTYTGYNGDLKAVQRVSTAPYVDLSDPNVDLVDINSDGLPDILDTNRSLHSYYINKGLDNTGELKWDDRKSMTTYVPPYLSNPSIQIADMDGDGKSEILEILGQTTRFYGINDNLDWEEEGTLTGTQFDLSDPSVKLMDVNNDKYIDVVQSYGRYLFIWINLKNGRWSNQIIKKAPDSYLQFDLNSTKVADMNGDRIPDLVFIENYTCYYYPGMGYGNFGERVYMNNAPTNISDNTRIMFADVNGDGMSDVIYVSDQIRVWLNNGYNVNDHASGVFSSPFIIYSSILNNFTAFRQADINGNGSTDIVFSLGSELAFIDFASEEQPYQLKTVTNGIGLRTTFHYKSSTEDMQKDRDEGNSWTETIPFPVPVLSKTVLNDGLNDYETEFFYHNGYFHAEDQEFRGFVKAEQIEKGDNSAPDLISAYTFDTGKVYEALKGKPLELILKNTSDQIFKKDTFIWEVKELLSGADPYESRKVRFAYQKEKLSLIVEKGAGDPVQVKWEYEYDDYGNLTKEISYGRLDNGWNDEKVVETRYSASYSSGLSCWILDLPVEITTKDIDGNIFAHRINYYDKSDSVGFVEKGNLTKVRDWVDSNEYVITERKDYDEYGNVIFVYDPLYGTEPGHYRQIEYDTKYNTFPVKEHAYTGSLTLTISADYDYGFGAVKSSTDYNGNTTSYGYDTFGRKSWIQKPLDSSHTEEYEYVLAHDFSDDKKINWIETRKKDGSSDGFLKSRTFFDGLKRKIMTRSEGETSGQIVVSDTQIFNAKGQAYKKYLPYFETGTLDFAEPTYQTGFTEHFYDAMGREIKFVQPGGAFSTITYSPFSKTVQDEEQTDSSSEHYGCGKRYVEDALFDKDGKGRLREVYEIVKISDLGEKQSSLVEWKTVYSYDVLNNLTSHTDSKNNTKIFTYDGLSRKTFMNDPDRGQVYFSYDNAGNLVSKTDAKNQTIKYQYDGVNRLIKEFYGADKTVPDITYHYDVAKGEISKGELSGNEKVTALNTLGYLSWVEDLSGEEHNSYDINGRVSWVVKSVKNYSSVLKSYYTEFQYDSMNRVVKKIFPDKTYATFTYNDRGLLKSVPNVINSLSYNPTGQNKELIYVTGTVTNYTYDDRLRLKTLKTVRARDNLPLQDITYTYDNISNITAIKDNRTDTVLSAIGQDLSIDPVEAAKFNSSQNFEYDSLYRLTKAYNLSVYGAIDYRIDRIGNIINKSATLLTPDPLMDIGDMTIGGNLGSSDRFGRESDDPAGPHALTGTQKGAPGPMSFTYDANGNMTFERGMVYEWDFKDRLVKMTEGTKSAFYKYDYTGTRKHKFVNDSSTGTSKEVIYIDKNTEVRKGDLVKYLYAGTLRIAKSTVQNNSETQFVPENYFLYNHLGSASITIDGSENVAELFAYYPYGKIRVSKKGSESIADYKFTGKERDEESDLDYFEMRYYSSTLMRFNRVDPLSAAYPEDWIGDPQQLNFYSYCRNNPLIHIDPSGEILFPVLYVWAVSVAAAPDTMLDMQLTAASLAEGDYIGAGINFLCILAPGISGGGHLSKPIREFIKRIGGKGFDLAIGLASHTSKRNPFMLKNFAKKVGAKTYLDIYDTWGFKSYGQLKNNIIEAMKGADKIKVNLDCLIDDIKDFNKILDKGLKGIEHKWNIDGLEVGNITNWEVKTIYNKFRDKAIWYFKGKEVSIPKK